MATHKGGDDPLFREAVQGLLKGNFTRSEPLFNSNPSPDRHPCRILEWHEKGYFDKEPKALDEAFTCACFLGQTKVAEFLLASGIEPTAGMATGLNAFHWAASGGKLDVVKLLIEHKVPMEIKNRYGGTVLGQAIWSAINEPQPDHIAVIEALLGAGARIDGADYPTGNERVDEVLRSHGAEP